MFAVEHWGVEPDMMCLGKGIGGGVMPLGAVLGSERAMGGYDDVPTGSTWAWLPAACARRWRRWTSSSRSRCSRTCGRWTPAPGDAGQTARAFAVVGDVRIKGCDMAVEFVSDRETKGRAPELQEAVAEECLRRGLLADSSTATYNLQPSLVMPVAALDRAVAILEEAILGGSGHSARSPAPTIVPRFNPKGMSSMARTRLPADHPEAENTITRKVALQRGAGLIAGLSVGAQVMAATGAETALAARVREAAELVAKPGYGPLVQHTGEMSLPAGFHVSSFGHAWSPMSDGLPTPRFHDGTTCVGAGHGRVRLLRNHEGYDPGKALGRERVRPRAQGGVTNSLFDTRTGKLVESALV